MMNQVLEGVLWSYWNDEQNNWASLLWIKEYAYNNSKDSVTKVSQFYKNYPFEQHMNWSTTVHLSNPAFTDIICIRCTNDSVINSGGYAD